MNLLTRSVSRRQALRARGRAFVTDVERGGWLPAADAVYLLGRVRTPMTYQLAAYRNRPADAEPTAVLQWRELLAQGVSNAAGR